MLVVLVPWFGIAEEEELDADVGIDVNVDVDVGVDAEGEADEAEVATGGTRVRVVVGVATGRASKSWERRLLAFATGLSGSLVCVFG